MNEEEEEEEDRGGSYLNVGSRSDFNSVEGE